MTLEEIPVVVIDFTGYRKFIVAQLTLGESTKTILRTGDSYGAHKDILVALWEGLRGSDIKANCPGGGFIMVNRDQKTIDLSGYSVAFGREPDRQETVRLIQAAYPDFTVKEE